MGISRDLENTTIAEISWTKDGIEVSNGTGLITDKEYDMFATLNNLCVYHFILI